jgi:hypothetical protein
MHIPGAGESAPIARHIVLPPTCECGKLGANRRGVLTVCSAGFWSVQGTREIDALAVTPGTRDPVPPVPEIEG